MAYKTFEELKVWQQARDLRINISVLVTKLPEKERKLLCWQLIRSSRSVTANIAEGFGRYHFKENMQFCRQARGSLFEILDHVICAFDEKYISEFELCIIRSKIENCIRILNGYLYWMKKALRNVK